MSKIGDFADFLQKLSLKITNFLHDGRRQSSASFEYGAIFGENLNPGLIRDEAHFASFSTEICQFTSFSLDILV